MLPCLLRLVSEPVLFKFSRTLPEQGGINLNFHELSLKKQMISIILYRYINHHNFEVKWFSNLYLKLFYLLIALIFELLKKKLWVQKKSLPESPLGACMHCRRWNCSWNDAKINIYIYIYVSYKSQSYRSIQISKLQLFLCGQLLLVTLFLQLVYIWAVWPTWSCFCLANSSWCRCSSSS